MQKAVIPVLFFILLAGFASYGLADELTLKESGPGQWTIYDSEGQDIGTLSKVGKENPEFEAGGYSILPKGGQYIGVVTSNGDLQLLPRHASVTPSMIRIYLDVLEAMKTLK